MSTPHGLPVAANPMPRQPPASARSVADFFYRTLRSFQASSSNLQVICTAVPVLHRENFDHGEPTPLPPGKRPRTLIVLDSSFNPPTRAHLRMATSAISDLVHRRGQKLSTMRLLLLLSVNNADKGVKPAAFEKRLAMMWAFARDVQHGVRGEAKVAAAEGIEGQEGQQEPEAEGLSVDLGLATLPYFHEKSAVLAAEGFYRGEGHADCAGETEQVFLVGYDTLIRIFNPRYYSSPESVAQVAGPDSTPMSEALNPFFGRARLRVTMRTGDEWGEADEQRLYMQELLRGEGIRKVGGSREWGKRIEVVEGRAVGADIVSSTYARAAAKDRDSDRLSLMVTPGVQWWIEQEALYIE